MEERKLEALQFSFAHKDEKGKKIVMSTINGIDLLDYFFTDFVKFIDDFEPPEKTKRIVQFGRKENQTTSFNKKSDKRSITGIIETGIYGKEENVIDISKKDVTVFTIHKNHSVQKPFFFLICIPQIKSDGFVLLERDGQFGIKSIFTHLFKKFVEIAFKDYVVTFTNYIDDKIIEKFITDGGYNTIKLTRNSLPVDVAERYGLESFQTDDFVVELTIKAKGKRRILGLARKNVIDIFKSSPNGFFSSEEFCKMGFDDKATIKVKSTYKDSSRTIDLSDTMKFAPYYKIEVDLNDSGHSNFNSIESEAIKLLDQFNLDLY